MIVAESCSEGTIRHQELTCPFTLLTVYLVEKIVVVVVYNVKGYKALLTRSLLVYHG